MLLEVVTMPPVNFKKLEPAFAMSDAPCNCIPVTLKFARLIASENLSVRTPVL